MGACQGGIVPFIGDPEYAPVGGDLVIVSFHRGLLVDSEIRAYRNAFHIQGHLLRS